MGMNKALPTMPPKAQPAKPTQGGTGVSATVSGNQKRKDKYKKYKPSGQPIEA